MTDIGPFLDLLGKSRRMVALTGAGVSTLSGIPDFRSSDGLFSEKYGSLDVETIVSINFFNKHPDIFYSWARDYWFRMETFEPNVIHKTLARLEKMGKLTEGIFTQNVDFLHKKAGSRKVYPLHGTLERGYCTNCNAYYEYEYMRSFVERGEVPVCSSCSSVVKPDIVFYGENLDSTMLRRAESAFSYADLVLVLGSSLVVNPAASLPYLSIRSGSDIVIVNRDSTYLDKYAQLRYEDLGSFFTSLSDALDDEALTR